MSGAAAYANDSLELGADLEGSHAVNGVEMTLEDAVKPTIESKLKSAKHYNMAKHLQI